MPPQSSALSNQPLCPAVIAINHKGWTIFAQPISV